MQRARGGLLPEGGEDVLNPLFMFLRAAPRHPDLLMTTALADSNWHERPEAGDGNEGNDKVEDRRVWPPWIAADEVDCARGRLPSDGESALKCVIDPLQSALVPLLRKG